MKAFRERQLTSFVQTRVIVESVVYAGNLIASTMSNSDNSPGPDKINDLLDDLRSLLMPEFKEDKERRAKKFKRLMEQEVSQGPFKVEGMSYGKKRKR